MSLKDIHRLAAGFSEAEVEEQMKEFALSIKNRGGWDIKANPFGPNGTRPIRASLFGLAPHFASLGGKYITDQFGEVIKVSFDLNVPDQEFREVDDFEAGMNAFQESGIEPAGHYATPKEVKSIVDQCSLKGRKRKGWIYQATSKMISPPANLENM